MSVDPEVWMVAALAAPLAAAALALVAGRRGAACIGVLGSGAAALAVAVLVAALAEHGPLRYAVGGWGAPLGIDLYADGLTAAMLAMNALVGLAVSVYALGYFDRALRGEKPRDWLFWPAWLMLWGGLNALYLSGDLFNLYVTLELVGMASVALVALAGGAAVAAALRYLLLALAGSLLYIVGVELLYASHGSLDLRALAEAIEPGAATWTAAALMTAGLLVKTALFPLHFWLPPAHSAAPAPVSAALSALVVKAGFYLLLRLWVDLFGPVTATHALQFLGALGAAAVLWGSLQALRQERVKLMVAYSTVAQIGYLFILFPLARAPGATAGAITLAVAHALAKAALFMGAGSLIVAFGHDRIRDLGGFGARLPLTVLALGLASVSLIGLPPSGGFIGKWMLIEAALASGAWWWALPVAGGGLLAAAYLFRLLAQAFLDPAIGAAPGAVPRTMQWTALALAFAALALGFNAQAVVELLEVGAGQPA